MNLSRRIGSGVVSLAVAAGTIIVAAPTAQAVGGTAHGCAYPRVCFYSSSLTYQRGQPVAAYQDMGYQRLGPLSSKAA